MLVICRKRDTIDMVATPSGLVMMIITMMVITLCDYYSDDDDVSFRKKRDAIDMLAGPVFRNHEVDDYI